MATAPAIDMNAAVAAALASFPGAGGTAPAVADPLLAAAAAAAGVPVPQAAAPAVSPAFDMLAAARGVPAPAAAAAEAGPPKSTGKVKQFDEDKGFGFIVPDDGSDDIFVHRNVAGNDRTSYLVKGETIEFEKEWDTTKNKWKAKSCTGFRSRQEEGGEPPRKQQCNDFKRGQCTRGDRCKFAHDDDNDNNSNGGWNSGGWNDWKSGGDWNSNGNNNNNGWNNGGDQGGNQQGGWGGAAAAPAAAAGGPLPPGWESATDPNTGATYYANRATGESSWIHPGGATPAAAPAVIMPQVAMPAAVPAALPLGWEAAIEPTSGKTYYANRSTGETSWTPPAAQPQPVAPVLLTMPAAAAGGLPAGWETTTDPNSGKTYYFNRATGVTSWTPPTA